MDVSSIQGIATMDLAAAPPEIFFRWQPYLVASSFLFLFPPIFLAQFCCNYFVMLCAIWYYLYNLKNVKNTQGVMLLLVKLQAIAYNFTESNTLPWMFFLFFEFYKCYQIAQRTTFMGVSFIEIFALSWDISFGSFLKSSSQFNG